MSEFKFGDLVNHEELGLGLVVRDESETQGYYVEVRFKDTGQTHPFSNQWKPDFNMHTNALTLISRHQEWVKFDIENPYYCPKIGETYLVANKNTKPFVYEFKYDLADWSWFTHYMALPTPPKELL